MTKEEIIEAQKQRKSWWITDSKMQQLRFHLEMLDFGESETKAEIEYNSDNEQLFLKNATISQRLTTTVFVGQKSEKHEVVIYLDSIKKEATFDISDFAAIVEFLQAQ